MRLVVLTTQTTHHAYFVRELANTASVQGVLVETKALAAPFKTFHSFETDRDQYEHDMWFNGGEIDIHRFADTVRFEDLNSPEARRHLKNLKPDAVVVFGTGRLVPEVIAVCPYGMVNLHGGSPEDYRGLDTHLWAVYHQDFESLVSTLHRVTSELDAGDIVAETAVPVSANMGLHQLRAANTEKCLSLTIQAIKDFSATQTFASRPQKREGRSYSFMPSVLKEICVINFRRYTRAMS